MGKIQEELEQALEEMCEHFCKYPEQWNPEEHDGMELFESDICENCPLSKL